jgi:hypothetical protein
MVCITAQRAQMLRLNEGQELIADLLLLKIRVIQAYEVFRLVLDLVKIYGAE